MRRCQGCQADISARRSNVKWCDRRCFDIARGMVRAVPFPSRRCALPECGESFRPYRAEQRCCSERHGKLLYNRESRADGRQPVPSWDDRRRDNYHRRRALKKAAASGAPVLLAEIVQRDAGCCHLCGEAVPDVAYPHPLSASLDHVVPLSRGGTHDPSNVKLSHLRCNVAKGNREGVAWTA